MLLVWFRFFLVLSLLGLGGALQAKDAQKACVDCHQNEQHAWLQSDHAKAMAEPSDTTVLGNFQDVTTAHYGQKARFFKQDQKYMVEVGYNNKLQRLPIKYTFGHYPLQQYLVETTPGSLQVLPFAWDSRDKAQGGQRWYHNYANEEIVPEDRLHWRQPLQNWNGMCADCHSDGLKRGYDSKTNTFNTQWTGINVSCVSCHGKMSDHQKSPISPPTKTDGQWQRMAEQDTATWHGKARDNQFMDTCFACHSLRAPLVDGINPGKPFLEQFTPQLNEAPLYHVDGQIKEEVYVYGSFLQSKMFANGVNCLDCHDKHTMKIKIEGNGLCLQCHSNETFNVKSHHQHQQASAGAQCVNCHMPTTRYMGVDDRRDHSFKIPRPHLSTEFSTPNACVDCHKKLDINSITSVSNRWASEQLRQWQLDNNKLSQTALDLMRLRQGQALSLKRHFAIIADDKLATISRATALRMLGNRNEQLQVSQLQPYINHEEELLRVAAAQAGQSIPLPARINALEPLLSDKFRAVRVAAARALVDAGMSVANLPVFQQAFAQLTQANELSSWRGEGRLNKGIVEITTGDLKKGEASLIAAIQIDPYFEASYVNLADLYRLQKQPMQVALVLKQGLESLPKSAALNYSFGLHLIRVGQRSKATSHFNQAMIFAPQTVQYVYTYALALDGEGKTTEGIKVLREKILEVPYSQQLQQLGVYLSQKAQDRESYQWFQRLAR